MRSHANCDDANTSSRTCRAIWTYVCASKPLRLRSPLRRRLPSYQRWLPRRTYACDGDVRAGHRSTLARHRQADCKTSALHITHKMLYHSLPLKISDDAQMVASDDVRLYNLLSISKRSPAPSPCLHSWCRISISRTLRYSRRSGFSEMKTVNPQPERAALYR